MEDEQIWKIEKVFCDGKLFNWDILGGVRWGWSENGFCMVKDIQTYTYEQNTRENVYVGLS